MTNKEKLKKKFDTCFHILDSMELFFEQEMPLVGLEDSLEYLLFSISRIINGGKGQAQIEEAKLYHFRANYDSNNVSRHTREMKRLLKNVKVYAICDEEVERFKKQLLSYFQSHRLFEVEYYVGQVLEDTVKSKAVDELMYLTFDYIVYWTDADFKWHNVTFENGVIKTNERKIVIKKIWEGN